MRAIGRIWATIPHSPLRSRYAALPLDFVLSSTGEPVEILVKGTSSYDGKWKITPSQQMEPDDEILV